jgi:hypothetical protein
VLYWLASKVVEPADVAIAVNCRVTWPANELVFSICRSILPDEVDTVCASRVVRPEAVVAFLNSSDVKPADDTTETISKVVTPAEVSRILVSSMVVMPLEVAKMLVASRVVTDAEVDRLENSSVEFAAEVEGEAVSSVVILAVELVREVSRLTRPEVAPKVVFSICTSFLIIFCFL